MARLPRVISDHSHYFDAAEARGFGRAFVGLVKGQRRSTRGRVSAALRRRTDWIKASQTRRERAIRPFAVVGFEAASVSGTCAIARALGDYVEVTGVPRARERHQTLDDNLQVVPGVDRSNRTAFRCARIRGKRLEQPTGRGVRHQPSKQHVRSRSKRASRCNLVIEKK